MKFYKNYIEICKKENNGKNLNSVFQISDKNDKLLIIMFKYTEAFFEFLYFLCKDNIIVKTELYKHIHIFFFFINISQNCVKCFIEIIKDSPDLIRELCKDCQRNRSFRESLIKIYEMNLIIYQNLNVIDLIFEYIKISKYDNEEFKAKDINKESRVKFI